MFERKLHVTFAADLPHQRRNFVVARDAGLTFVSVRSEVSGDLGQTHVRSLLHASILGHLVERSVSEHVD